MVCRSRDCGSAALARCLVGLDFLGVIVRMLQGASVAHWPTWPIQVCKSKRHEWVTSLRPQSHWAAVSPQIMPRQLGAQQVQGSKRAPSSSPGSPPSK